MERLTTRCGGYAVMAWEHEEKHTTQEWIDMLTDRLAAYEDLMERWKLRSIEEADRIFQRVNDLGGTDLMAQYRDIGSIDHLRDLLQAEQDGRLVVLPCKVGDTVWYITPSTEICEAQVIGIWLNVYTNPKMWLEIKYYSKFTGECEHKSRIDLMLDKTVFLTREEAEAALKGGEG